MKLQRCQFKREYGMPWESGIAKVKDFGISDVDWILDINGDKCPEIWDYHLQEGPLAYLEQLEKV